MTDDNPDCRNRNARRMARRAQGASQGRKTLTRMRDLVAAERRRAAMGQGRGGLRLRHARGEEDARRSLRRAQPAHHPSLHVRPRLGGGLPELLAGGRPCRRFHRSSREPRRRLCPRRARRSRSWKPTRTDGLDARWVSSTATTSTTTSTCRSRRKSLAKGKVD